MIKFTFLKRILFICICLAARSLSSGGMWDLVPWPGIELGPPTSGTWSLNHWPTREVPTMAPLKYEVDIARLRLSYIMSYCTHGTTWSEKYNIPVQSEIIVWISVFPVTYSCLAPPGLRSCLLSTSFPNDRRVTQPSFFPCWRKWLMSFESNNTDRFLQLHTWSSEHTEEFGKCKTSMLLNKWIPFPPYHRFADF